MAPLSGHSFHFTTPKIQLSKMCSVSGPVEEMKHRIMNMQKGRSLYECITIHMQSVCG